MMVCFSVTRAASSSRCSRAAAAMTTTTRRTFASDSGEKKEMPFGLGKVFGVSDPDNLIATDRDRKIHKGDIPDFLPDDVN